MLRQHSLQQRPPAVNASDGRRRCDREPDGEFSGAVLRESRVDRRGIGLEGGCHPRHHRNRQVGAAQLELRRERPGYGLVNRNSRKTIGVILGLRDSRCQEAQGSEQREPSHQSRVSLGRHRAERVPRSPTLRGARANCVEITQGPEVPLAQNCAQARPETPEPEIVREPQSQRQIDPGRIRVDLPRVHRQYLTPDRPYSPFQSTGGPARVSSCGAPIPTREASPARNGPPRAAAPPECLRTASDACAGGAEM